MAGRGKEIIELQHEFESMPEMATIRRIRSFGYTLEILHGNYQDLKKCLEYHADYKQNSHLWNVENRHLLEAFQKVVVRLLHNFVAASMTCIDHSRVLYRHVYEEDLRFPDYQDEVKKRFAENPLVQFVVCLRQYCQHYKTPTIQSELNTKDLPKINSRLQLIVKDLCKFDGWNTKAKEFIKSQKEKIDLLYLIDSYYRLLMDFYRWFNGRQNEIHKKELEAVNAKQDKLRELRVLDVLERELKDRKAFERDFILILSLEERNELETCCSNMEDRSRKVLELIGLRTNLNAELKSKIQKLYL